MWFDPLLLLVSAALSLAPVVFLLAFSGCGKPLAIEPEPEPPPANATPTPAPAAAPAIYAEVVKGAGNLISYWRLAENSGTDAEDSAPTMPRKGTYKEIQDGINIRRGVPGVLAEAASPAVDPLDKCAEFLEKPYVEVSYDLRRNPPLSFSVEVWLSTAEGQQTPRYVVSSCQVNGAGDLTAGYAIDVAFNPLRVRARVGMKNATGQLAEFQREVNLNTGPAPVGGKWWHVVMTFDGVGRSITVWVNNQPGTTAAPAALNGFNYVAAISPTPLRIASGPEAGGTAPGRYFKGFLDEVALYNPPLSNAQIQAHFLAATVKGA